MTDDQYRELVDFLGVKFDRIETRTAGLEVGHEQLRDDIRQVAEGVSANSERIDRLETTMNRRFDRLEEGWWVRFDDHERRIRKLEG